MATKKTKRRQAGEGGISEYATKAGPRFLIKYRDQQGAVKLRRGFPTRKAAADALKEILVDIKRGQYVDPADGKITVEAWLAQWIEGKRLAPSSVASYRRNIRTHINPSIGQLTLDQLTGPRITAFYRHLETAGRADYKEGVGLSARSVRYVHTILKAALTEAVRNGKLLKNPADLASPPSAKEARPPEMRFWTADQLSTFLAWAAEHRADIAPAWHLLAFTGMRRGELLGLRWRDVDLDAGRLSVRRSIVPVRTKGQALELIEGTTKTGNARVVDVDSGTVEVLRAYRVTRGSLALPLVRGDAYVFGNEEGGHFYPDGFTRRFTDSVAACGKALGVTAEGDGRVPPIRLHDLRHTHAAILLGAGFAPKDVAARLGHTVGVLMTTYAHVMPGAQSRMAAGFASLVKGA